MKTGEDFRREFPEAEEGFRDAVHDCLLKCHVPQRRARMRIKPVIAFVLIIALMASVGMAATVEKWSFFNLISVPEDEIERTKSSFQPVSMDGSWADVTIREAVYDGFAVYMVIDVRPDDLGVFLIPDMNAALDDPASRVVSGFPSDVTLAEHIKALGYHTAYRVDVINDLTGYVYPATLELNEDGSFTFYCRQRMTEEKNMMQPSLSTAVHVDIKRYTENQVANGSTILEYAEAELTMDSQPLLEAKRSVPGEWSDVFVNMGVRVSEVEVYRTVLSTYVDAAVEIVDREKYASRGTDYSLFIADREGGSLRSGPFNIYGITEKPYRSGNYRFNCTLMLEKLPDEMNFVEYAWDAERNKTITQSYAFRLENIE